MSDLNDSLTTLQQANLSSTERLRVLDALYNALKEKTRYAPPCSPPPDPSFFDRHPLMKFGLSVGVAGFFMFCDAFVGVSTILAGLIELTGVIFFVSLTLSLGLMALVILLQLSVLSKLLNLTLLTPPQNIHFLIEESQRLKQLCQLIESALFLHACQNEEIATKDYQQLLTYLQDRTRVIQEEAQSLEDKRQSTKVRVARIIALSLFALSSIAAGIATGYFFISALVFCFSLVMPFWIPIVFSIITGGAAFLIFQDTQAPDVARMVEWAFNCDQSWIDALQDPLIEPTRVTTHAQLFHLPSDATQTSPLSGNSPASSLYFLRSKQSDKRNESLDATPTNDLSQPVPTECVQPSSR